MIKGKLIIFTGIDGSGKTTLTRTLVERLEKENIRASYLWWFSAENSFLRRKMRSLTGAKKTGPPENKKEKLPGSLLVRTLYQYLVLLDYYRQTIFRVWLPIIRGRNVVCDRYVYDIVVSFAMEFRYSRTRARKLLELLLKVSPRPDIAFFVDVPVETAIQRKTDIPSKEHHEKLRNLYQEIIKGSMTVLDGSRSPEELNNVVWGLVDNHLIYEGEI